LPTYFTLLSALGPFEIKNKTQKRNSDVSSGRAAGHTPQHYLLVNPVDSSLS
jgi:hypothetical protein